MTSCLLNVMAANNAHAFNIYIYTILSYYHLFGVMVILVHKMYHLFDIPVKYFGIFCC